jgi:hypothetical protein
MTLKALLDAIQDAKITADLVVSDRGRLQPVTAIRAMGNVVMLICRPRPAWGMPEDCRPAGSMTLEQTQASIKESKRKRTEEDRIRLNSAKWEREEIAKAERKARCS